MVGGTKRGKRIGAGGEKSWFTGEGKESSWKVKMLTREIPKGAE